jgi:hypothetical protein
MIQDRIQTYHSPVLTPLQLSSCPPFAFKGDIGGGYELRERFLMAGASPHFSPVF